jgi:hypothetical protein
MDDQVVKATVGEHHLSHVSLFPPQFAMSMTSLRVLAACALPCLMVAVWPTCSQAFVSPGRRLAGRCMLEHMGCVQLEPVHSEATCIGLSCCVMISEGARVVSAARCRQLIEPRCALHTDRITIANLPEGFRSCFVNDKVSLIRGRPTYKSGLTYRTFGGMSETGPLCFVCCVDHPGGDP